MRNNEFKITAILALLFGMLNMNAQQATVASGGNATGSGGKVSYSIGQVAYKSISGSNGNINQGVQQPFEIFTLENDDFPEITLMMSVYPNPTTSSIHLNIQNQELGTLNYQLFDLLGKQIANQKIIQSDSIIDMENLPTATYLLLVIDQNKTLKTFKIIKK